jgi:Tfp pilus assembly protein PilF
MSLILGGNHDLNVFVDKKRLFPLLIPFVIVLLFLASCSIPQIYVIEDPLTASQHNELGYIYEGQGKYGLAEKEYRAAIRKQKDWPVPYFNLGNVYFKMGDPARAEECYREAIERDPGHSDAMNNLAYILCEQSRNEEAQRWIDKALSIHTKKEYLDTQEKIFSKKSSSSGSR